MSPRPKNLRSNRIARMREQETKLFEAIAKRETPTPTPHLNARGVPAVNALSVRVTERYAGARMGKSTWADVSIRETRKPTWALGHTSPVALTDCTTRIGDGPESVFKQSKSRNYTRKTSDAALVIIEREQSRLRSLHIAGELGNTD